MKVFKKHKLYKVVVDGHSVWGKSDSWVVPGTFLYDLPEKGKPGEWMTVDHGLVMCQTGFHVTIDPRYWRDAARAHDTTRGKCQLYEVEIQKPLRHRGTRDLVVSGGWKICAKKMRLLRRVPWKQAPPRVRYRNGKLV